MKTLNLKVKTSLAAVTLAAATLLTPAMAHAGDYRYEKCKDTENAVAGALVGGTLGSVIGKEIAGRGDNTEGAILGAIVGGITGAAIGDGVNDCEKTNNRRGYTTTRGYTTRPVVQTVGYHGSTSHGYHDRDYGYNDRGYNDRNDRRYYRTLRQLDRRIDDLRRERDRLAHSRNRGRGYAYGHSNKRYRIEQIGREIRSLKNQRKRVKKYGVNRRVDRRDYRVTERGHYHGSNICYSDH